ncbi:type IV pilus biogenesis protein PilM [Noviherbaspirillum aerium]|uniref:agglutinin biogenesis protein MshI n=1 Tax=Noviherbaspirillum aerium TaxID=2588497 RepID=UPI001CEF6EED|nr:agglutinin biogenesis protein MshI [Noviherbaspirillum aerium]
MAISLQDDGVYAAHITRPDNARPIVELAAFQGLDGSSHDQGLEKLAREVGASRYRCATLLQSGDYQMLSVDAPSVPAEELKGAIRWRIKDMLDFPVDEATVDVLNIPADKNGGNRSQAMYAVAARNAIVQKRQELMARAKVPLAVIDIPEMAQRNLSALLAQEGRGLAFLSFGGEGGLLTVTYAGELYLSRRIDVPFSQLQQAYGDALTSCHERITLELQRSLDHFERQYGFITVARLVLSPMGEAGEALRNYLSSNLYVAAETLDLAGILDLSRVPDLASMQSQQKYLLTLGAALRQEVAA